MKILRMAGSGSVSAAIVAFIMSVVPACSLAACSGGAARLGEYPVHDGINATIFWVGEVAHPDNGYIPNAASAWDSNWTEHYGGIDDPLHRQNHGYWPVTFVPSENPFYVALPYGEYASEGVKPNVDQVYWYDPDDPPTMERSILKNRWAAITYEGKTAYAQWQDVGPFESDDVNYVFGPAAPRYAKAGIDLSPATAFYLGIEGRGVVSWQFVDEDLVPSGPWRDIITTRQVSR